VSTFVSAAKAGDIVPGTGKAVVIGGREIALFNVGGAFYALENACPHAGAPLADGWLDDETVTCSWHGWCFRLADGKMTLGDFSSVAVFDVKVEGGDVLVDPTPRRR
jgi:nitrite reductase/ring-hydroxylating ferredoxin subunit